MLSPPPLPLFPHHLTFPPLLLTHSPPPFSHTHSTHVNPFLFQMKHISTILPPIPTQAMLYYYKNYQHAAFIKTQTTSIQHFLHHFQNFFISVATTSYILISADGSYRDIHRLNLTYSSMMTVYTVTRCLR